MNRRLAWGLGIATAVLLLAALLGADRLRKDDPDAPEGVAPIAAPPGGTPAAAEADGEVYRGDQPRLSGTARSLAYEGRIHALARVVLPMDITAVTEVFDAQGRSLGRGTLTTGGRSTTVEGSGLAIDTAFTAKPGPITIDRGHLVAAGNVMVSAPKITLTTTEHPEGRPLPSPVRVSELDGVAIDAPTTIDAPVLKLGNTSNRTTLSWAGGGRIEVPGHRAMTGQWLGIKAHDVDVTLRTADLFVEGTFKARQVYVDGSPRLKADKVQVDIVNPAEAVAAGSRTWFDWAPRNRSDIDMVITRIRPDSPQAAWVNLALDRMPAMFGGERRDPAGGDTTGLGKNGGGGLFSGKASAIDAVILPRTADRESISVDVPAGTPPGVYQLAVVFEGNFDPVRVVVPVEVAGGPPPT